MTYMVYEYFWATGANEAVLDYFGLFSITSNDDDIQDFDTRWDQVLSTTSGVPNDKICTRCEYESLINSK